MQVTCLAGRGAILGEGPVWDAARGCLWWIDIEGRCLHCYDAATGQNSVQAMPGRPGFVALHVTGQLVLGIERAIVLFDPVAGKGVTLAEVDAEGVRINDGFCDSDGQLWFGTMDDNVAQPLGALYRLNPDGPEAAITGVIASNGPAFSTDGRSLFHCDTLGRQILHYPLLPGGNLGPGTVFRTFAEDEGLPDGMACDTDGGLWVGLWGGGCVVRLDQSGAVSSRVSVSATQVTACAFGGPKLDMLFITTAALGLSRSDLAAAPDSGELFICSPGWQGMAPTPMQDLNLTYEWTPRT